MELRRNAFREGTRRDIIDMLLLRDAPYHGRLEYMDFLKRVWPLDEMPSEDRRFTNATADIATHRASVTGTTRTSSWNAWNYRGDPTTIS